LRQYRFLTNFIIFLITCANNFLNLFKKLLAPSHFFQYKNIEK